MKQRRHVFMQEAAIIPITELARMIAPAPVPELFTRCFKCPKPSVYLVCLVSQDEHLQEPAYAEAAAAALAEELRDTFGGNLELTMCEEHFQSSKPNYAN